MIFQAIRAAVNLAAQRQKESIGKARIAFSTVSNVLENQNAQLGV